MRIEKYHITAHDRESVERELRELIDEVGSYPPVCGPTCTNYSDLRCNRNCEDAPVHLSSDPDGHPIEPHIAPLVFELKKTGVFQPCWSCEGHNDHDGKLWKLPRVWFYARSVVHVRVLCHAVLELFDKNRLAHKWEVTVTFSDDDNLDTCFSLQPSVNKEDTNLPALQRDIEVISEMLHPILKFQVDKLCGSLT